MNQRTALTIAAAATAFVLALAVGLISNLAGANDTAASVASADAAAQQREAAYQQALADANARLEQANAQIAEANRRLAQQTEPGQAASQAAGQAQDAAPSYAVSAGQALGIAQAAAGDAAATTQAELVRFQGSPAYEVAFGSAQIYVDAQSGAVLYNGVAELAGAAPAGGQITPEQAAQAAQAYLGGGSVSSADMREVRGVQVYIVAFADGSQVYVDPATGQVVYAELTGGGEEREHEEREHEDREQGEGDHDD